MNSKKPTTLVLILGDQLSPNLSSLRAAEKSSTLILMAELADEASYVPHHKKKIAFVFSAMRHFNDELVAEGWLTAYSTFGEQPEITSFAQFLEGAIEEHKPQKLLVTEPNEYRLRKIFLELAENYPDLLTMLPDDRFICSESRFVEWAKDRKQPRMEYFYREMRRQTDLLMDGKKPVGGKWNFDSDNRKPPPKNTILPGPKKFASTSHTQKAIDIVAKEFPNNFGDLEPFWFAVTREQAEQAFEHFLRNALPQFGDYQDAMLHDEKFLFHSVIAQYLNVGLLDALDICRKVEQALDEGHVPINAAEGFIRQIIGWREYVRGIYWWKMPDYAQLNYFEHDRPLPEFYWTADTKMNCLAKCVSQTREEAYAHHIQRLMVTGNFAMLIGVSPSEVHEWYLAVYADAYEWVELPNTLGMSQFADGGLLGSKPYASGGNYINKMSDYCKKCHYKVAQKTGDSACPFNYLYWDFISRHEQKLRDNVRLKFAYRTWDKMTSRRKEEIAASAANFLKELI
ncbi:MAG: cryptochrome/photolyase family protein [Gammaproteobacteria bacterium]